MHIDVFIHSFSQNVVVVGPMGSYTQNAFKILTAVTMIISQIRRKEKGKMCVK